MKFQHLTIRAKLLWLTLGLVVPLVLAGFYNLWSFWLVSRAQLDESLVQQAQLAATAFEQQLIAHRQTLETVSSLAGNGLESNFTLREYLDSIVKTRPEWLDLQIVDREGNSILAQSSKPSNITAGSVADIKDEAERANSFVVSAEPYSDKKLHFFTFGQPIGNGNVVVARVDVTSANAVFENLKLPEENIIAVFDRNNQLVYRNQQLPEETSEKLIETPLFSALNAKREGIIEIESPYDGVERVYGLALVRTGNYVIAVGVPSSRLYSPALQQFARQAFFGLLIASLAIAAAFTFARHIVKPLHQLTKAARSFGEGETSSRADVADGGSMRELGLTFNKMADQIAEREEKLKELDRLKSEFVSSVSHELRTPLTTIKTLTRVLANDRISAEERTEYLQTIADECDRQIEFVQNLLDLSRIESGAYLISLVPVNAVKLMLEVAGINERSARMRNLSLTFDPPNDTLPPVLGDPRVLRQIVGSLVENAMKYTPENGAISLAVRQADRRIEIGIADNGCGIDPEDVPHIFEKFYQGRPLLVHDTSGLDEDASDYFSGTEAGGVGLGLYLVRNLVQQCGGDISVRSPASGLQKGTEFTVSLPLA
ncbi:MAG: HAMP domain-containing protein [Acidobacteria bacterium]|nr:HAMP domain-containing protein [Acidobacteriota bacterium]